ncbi:protein PHTF2-like isoform X2 [Hydractinia symbiolongicarpus]|uniref:protein PHTF2-like isoform X2 n=1 Tax=Hydractinia symbiolongicarpus TaxID=13093 RepID=UPI00254D0F8E|nr:protein PHTF2-like isoform X2 [Hydractinia symbiolongicarpus]
MGFSFHGAISLFQKKIGTYDKANWEVTVEKQEVQRFLPEKLSVANIPTDLLDIDLIRGSTFTKAKPGYHWTQVTASGCLKVFFYPLYYKWWQQQTSIAIWLFFLMLYFLQLIAIIIYMTHQNDDDFENISWPEALVPLLALVLLGEMYIHVVSTNFTKPIGHKIKKKQRNNGLYFFSSSGRTGRSKQTSRKSHNKRNNSKSKDTSNIGTEDIPGHINDTSVERPSREESVERVLHSNDDDRVIGGSETEVDSGYGIRNRFHQTKSGNGGTTTNERVTKTSGRSRKNSLRQSSGSVEDTSSNENSSQSSDSSTSSISDNDEVSRMTDKETADVLFPNTEGLIDGTQSSALCKIRLGNDLINVSIWDVNSFKKAKLTFFEIGMAVVKKVELRVEKSSDYLTFAIMSAILIGILPLTFRIYQSHVLNKDKTLFEGASQVLIQIQTFDGLYGIFKQLFGSSWKSQLVVFIAMVSRVTLSFAMFFLLCVAEGAYKMRYMYAKYFGALTSTRRARRNGLPHFRLHKVKNIKAWLSLRSFLKKRGPQRSVDTIVSLAFMFGVLLLVVACVQFLSINGKDDKEHFLGYFFSWEVSAWSLVLGVFLIRFIALGSDINRKYRNTSILLTEQINLYLQMERNSKKKEELLIANNVLKLASKLLKELEGPFKVSGFIMNPLLSNITRVVVLSLFSGVMSDILGFRLRLWKIKP